MSNRKAEKWVASDAIILPFLCFLFSVFFVFCLVCFLDYFVCSLFSFQFALLGNYFEGVFV